MDYICTIIFNYICILGPFSSDEMKQWFDAGYFTMDLMVCRRCDTIMLPLGMPLT